MGTLSPADDYPLCCFSNAYPLHCKWVLSLQNITFRVVLWCSTANLFKITTDRLDSFLFEVLQNQNESQQLWITMQLILTLSHGQATVERGFSVNKEVLAPNLQETSLVAMRLVHSSMQAVKCKVADFVVNDA